MLLQSSINRLYSREVNRRSCKSTLRNITICCLLTAGLAFLSACASVPDRQVAAVPVGQLQNYASASGNVISSQSAGDSIPDVNILFLSKEVTSVLDEKVLPIKNTYGRLAAIIDILNEKVRLDIETDKYATKTAMEAYETGTGNCLSFTSLFVAMARYAGIEAGYQEVSTGPNWSREGGVIFVSKHISAYTTIFTPYDFNVDIAFSTDNRLRIINGNRLKYYKIGNDVSPDGDEDSTTTTPIPDRRAFAQYYNNIASMHLAEGNSGEAFRYFIKALDTDPELCFIWSNLGVAYSRNQQLDAAEEAYLHALAVARKSGDISELSIMNNMVKLYERSGNEEKAAVLRAQVAAFRQHNPYYHYLAGQSAFSAAAYEESIKHFKAAIRRKKDDDVFYYSLALAYMKLGDLKKAEKNIDRALLYAWDDQTKDYYDSVLEKISRTALN